MKKPAKASLLSSPKKIFLAVVVVVIIGLTANIIISFFLDFQSLKDAVGRVRAEHLAAPFLIFVLIYCIDAIRLKIVLSQFNYRIKFADAFVNGLMGYFFANLTPMATGGQPFQIYHMKNLGIDAKTSTNIIASRFVEYLGSAILLTLAFIAPVIPILNETGADTGFILVGFLVSVAGSLIVILLFIRPDWIGGFLVVIERSFAGKLISRITKRTNWGETAKKWAEDLRRSIAFLWKEKFHVICIDILLCVLILGLQVFSLVLILMLLFDLTINFLQIFAVVLLLNLVVYYIPTPGASGGFEGVYTGVFAALTGSPQLSFVAIVIWRFATYYCQILFGIIVFFFMRRRGLFAPQESADKTAKTQRREGSRREAKKEPRAAKSID